MKAYAMIGLTLLSAFAGVGCTHYIGRAAINDLSGVCHPGASRTQIIAALGQPQRSRRFTPAKAYDSFRDAPVARQKAQVAVYDEYHVSGLTIISRNPYGWKYGEGEAIAAVATAGVSELVLVPFTATDLAARPFQRHPLRLWYDPSEHLIAGDDGPRWR